MENIERKMDSKLESALAWSTALGLVGTFQYNLWQALDKLDYFEKYTPIIGHPTDPMFEKAFDLEINLGLISGLGTTALGLGGLMLGMYVGRSIGGYIERKSRRKNK